MQQNVNQTLVSNGSLEFTINAHMDIKFTDPSLFSFIIFFRLAVYWYFIIIFCLIGFQFSEISSLLLQNLDHREISNESLDFTITIYTWILSPLTYVSSFSFIIFFQFSCTLLFHYLLLFVVYLTFQFRVDINHHNCNRI